MAKFRRHELKNVYDLKLCLADPLKVKEDKTMAKVKVFKNGNMNIRLEKGTLERFHNMFDKYGEETAYDNIMFGVRDNILDSLEEKGIYMYGWSELSCMTWSNCDYHDLYYNYDTDMKYDLMHGDIWNVLCKGKTLKLHGEKPWSNDNRDDIIQWIKEEHGYDDDYEDEEEVI